MNSIGENLKKIRLLKNLSLKQAGEILNMSAPAVAKYEKGEIVPNSQKLIEFANAYNVKTIDLLKSYNVPQMQFTSFRKKKRLTGKNLELLETLISEEISKYFEILELNNIENNNIGLPKYNCNSYEDAEKSAEEFRNKFINISSKLPISDLTNILENLGIIIVYMKNTNNKFDDFDGLSEIVDGKPVIVLLDDINDGARQRFTIAHELGHLVLKNNNIDDIEEEKLCHRFASALLMPKEAIIHEFGASRNKINFYELDAFKKEYKVSYKAIVYRLKDLNIISDYLYKNLNVFLNKYIGKNDKYPIMTEQSYQFERIVYKLEADEIISTLKACELLGVGLDEFNIKNNNYRH